MSYDVKTEVILKGQVREALDPYEHPYPIRPFNPNDRRRSRRARHQRGYQPGVTAEDLRETRRLEALEREHEAMEDGRHTLGGF